MKSPLLDAHAATAKRINAAHREAKEHAARAIERAIEAGDLLNEVKRQLGHGQWLPWLAQHCPDISVRTAQQYMQIARSLPAQMRSAAHLSIREVLRQLEAPPTDDEESPPERYPKEPDPAAEPRTRPAPSRSERAPKSPPPTEPEHEPEHEPELIPATRTKPSDPAPSVAVQQALLAAGVAVRRVNDNRTIVEKYLDAAPQLVSEVRTLLTWLAPLTDAKKEARNG